MELTPESGEQDRRHFDSWYQPDGLPGLSVRRSSAPSRSAVLCDRSCAS